jgi:hypothetical protein
MTSNEHISTLGKAAAHCKTNVSLAYVVCIEHIST